ncbi:MAG TPA: TetR/AcrR family transcriptional regulator [Longimicrobium sp.]|nr:TetR/AcrR family transcriptional regulator [Longimicrobium sp.]
MSDMKSPSPARGYRMAARADAAARTARDILAATVALWRERPIDEITLADIAGRAGVSVRTVIRRFGSREGVIAACIEADAAGIEAERGQAPPGSVEEALDVLLAHYERDGDAVLRTLALEEKLPEAKAIVRAGRAAHREWCARVFAAWLPPPTDGAHAIRLDAFVAATDLYAWKLLRRDLHRPATDTARVIRALVDGLVSLSSSQA